MITKVEARGFRCLRDVSQDLRPFQVLVGPNSSGKSAFLDVIGFVSDLLSLGLSQAILRRTDNFYDLVWGRTGISFELAIEGEPPSQIAPSSTLRYVIRIGLSEGINAVRIQSETLSWRDGAGNTQSILDRSLSTATFRDESGSGGTKLRVTADLSAAWNLPEGRTHFPVAGWFVDLLREGAELVLLDDKLLRSPSPPAIGDLRGYDGTNLAHTIQRVADSSPNDFYGWIQHIRTALPDLEGITTFLRPEDRKRYLMVRYRNGIEVPSWMLSGGTLRLLALTILAYVPDFHGVYLIEEPEVGLHPTAIETIMQSLSSVYGGQVLLTSHSPILLSLPEPRDLLCFQRTDQGTEIIPGDRHPMLENWRSGVSVSDLFAAGVLG